MSRSSVQNSRRPKVFQGANSQSDSAKILKETLWSEKRFFLSKHFKEQTGAQFGKSIVLNSKVTVPKYHLKKSEENVNFSLFRHKF